MSKELCRKEIARHFGRAGLWAAGAMGLVVGGVYMTAFAGALGFGAAVVFGTLPAYKCLKNTYQNLEDGQAHMSALSKQKPMEVQKPVSRFFSNTAKMVLAGAGLTLCATLGAAALVAPTLFAATPLGVAGVMVGGLAAISAGVAVCGSPFWNGTAGVVKGLTSPFKSQPNQSDRESSSLKFRFSTENQEQPPTAQQEQSQEPTPQQSQPTIAPTSHVRYAVNKNIDASQLNLSVGARAKQGRD